MNTETQRLVLFMIFAVSLFLLVDGWQREHAPKPAAPAPAAQAPAAAPASVPTPAATVVPAPGAATPAPAAPAVPGGAAARPASAVVRFSTDLYRGEIDLAGGDLRRLELRRYADAEDSSKPFVLFQRDPDRLYVAQSGLIGTGLPNHLTAFTADVRESELKDGVELLEIALKASTPEGIEVVKTYTFRRGSYAIELDHRIRNGSAAAVAGHAYYQFVRDTKPPVGDSSMVPTYTGMAVYTDKEKYQKVAFTDIEKGKATHPKSATDGWIGLIQHYFVSAWLADGNVPREFNTKKLDGGLLSAALIVPLPAIEAGKEATAKMKLFAGPQEQEKLAKLAPGLDLVVDYGWLTVIAVPLFLSLEWIYGWVGNWGIAIIIVTVVLKALFYPLSAASYKSMAKMRVVTPKLQRIREQYGDDRNRMNQAMMELYKTEKINPLGGCLPILVQIPVFIALYWVLLASVELRQAPFYFWIKDLSRPDPYFILPVLMAITMIVQTRLNPEPPDPVQAKVMKIMPVVFSVFFFFFAAGLVLYWLVNNILSIAQQWHITKTLEGSKPSHGKR